MSESKKVLTPVFLTKEIAAKSVNAAVTLVFNQFGAVLKRQTVHVVTLVPSMEDVRADDYPDYPVLPRAPFLLHEASFGDKRTWEHKFDDIARCKAQQLWYDQNVSGNMSVEAHLLLPGDTPYWGGVKRRGIVVACSGVQPYFDQSISGIAADLMIADARHAFETREHPGADFIAT